MPFDFLLLVAHVRLLSLRGERGGGAAIIEDSVFYGKDDAIKMALSQPAYDGPWVKSDSKELLWFSGCDYVSVERLKVR